MTPLGHITAAYLVGNSWKKIIIPAVIIGSVVPDVDYMLFFFPFFNSIHRVITHNIFFIVIVASLISVFYSKESRLILFTSILLGGILHLFLDSIIDANPENGTGIAFLWPLSESFFSPFNIAFTADNPAGWNNPLEQAKLTIYHIILEIPLVLGAVILFRKNRKKEIAFNNEPHDNKLDTHAADYYDRKIKKPV